MDRDRDIAMGLGSNTNAAATLTNHIKRVCLSILLTLLTLLLITENIHHRGVI
jgi:hypothetical protein